MVLKVNFDLCGDKVLSKPDTCQVLLREAASVLVLMYIVYGGFLRLGREREFWDDRREKKQWRSRGRGDLFSVGGSESERERRPRGVCV